MQFFIVVASSFIIPYFHVASRAEMILPLQIAMLGANGESWSDSDVGQMIIFQNGFNQLAARFGVADSFPHIKMENGSAGVFGLQFILQFQRFKSVAGVLQPNLGGVGVVRRFRRASLDYAGKIFWSSLAKR